MELSLSTALAFAVTAVLTLTLRPLALRLGITDKPGGRKQHIGEIPLIGGIAMFIGILVAAMTTVQTTGLWTLLVPAALLVVVGVIDDRYNIGVSARLAAQTCAVLVMIISGGLYLRDIGDPFGTGLLRLGILAVPGSVLVALSVINAFNFIDGIDGLAASMALIGLAAAGLATGVSAPAVSVAAVACGATLGFLLFNFPAFRNRRLRTAGREHFHYVLMRAGLSGRQVLAVLLAFSVLYSAVGLIGVRQKLPDWALFAPWFTLLASQSFIIRGLAVRLRHRRWRASSIVVRMPAAVAATHSYATQPRLAARQRNGQGLSGAGVQPQHDEAPLQSLGDSARPIEAHAPERGRMAARGGGGE